VKNTCEERPNPVPAQQVGTGDPIHFISGTDVVALDRSLAQAVRIANLGLLNSALFSCIVITEFVLMVTIAYLLWIFRKLLNIFAA